MGSFEDLHSFADLSRLGDLIKKESKAFGLSLKIKCLLIKAIGQDESFPGVGMPLSSSNISYPHLYQITYFWEGSALKINEKRWAPILFDTITDTKGPPYIFFRASARIADCG
jgi:hypothetical protein